MRAMYSLLYFLSFSRRSLLSLSRFTSDSISAMCWICFSSLSLLSSTALTASSSLGESCHWKRPTSMCFHIGNIFKPIEFNQCNKANSLPPHLVDLLFQRCYLHLQSLCFLLAVLQQFFNLKIIMIIDD